VKRSIAVSLICAATLAAQAQSAPASRPAAPRPQPSCAAVTPQICTIAQALGRGINLGAMLDAPEEGQWGVRLEPAYIDLAASRFATVRLPVRWSNHAALTADATLDEAFARRVDWAVDSLLTKGVYVILDLHNYTQLSSDKLHWKEAEVDPTVLEIRLVNLWRQIALRYQDRSHRLLFELLNEPSGRLDSEAWNELAPKVLAAVRASNPTRAVLIGPADWNAIPALPKLRLPPDRNLIVSIHNYDPFAFTHQGMSTLAHPFPTGTTCCDAAQRKQVTGALDAAVRWSRANGYPLHLGEFGANERADMQSRETYTRLVREEAERRGIGWTYWEFASEFGVYSPKTGTWVEPIRRALLD
jgi:endoglucanase